MGSGTPGGGKPAPGGPTVSGGGTKPEIEATAAGQPETGGADVSGAAGVASGGEGAGPLIVERAPNYEVTGTWPQQPVALMAKPGQLKYEKVVIHDQFLAESCSIADYDNDGLPDVSSGRIWYAGPDFKAQHPFRDGHGPLPRNGSAPELNTGVADDWADYPFDVNADGNTDIINCAQVDVDEVKNTPNAIGTVQHHSTCYWYQNPGRAGQSGDPNWTPHLLHNDVRLEQHGLIDMNGDGFPELYGACKSCMPPETKGYYQANQKDPTAPWSYHAVTGHFTFPFGGLGKLHGEGGGDVNGDGLPDLLERTGAWLQQPDGTFNEIACTSKNTPKGCGFIEQDFYDGLLDNAGNKGPSHMYAVDMDLDGVADVVAADWAHGEGLFWYRQDGGGKFTKYQFMGGANPTDQSKWGAGFSEPHALQVVDMDGDGRPDVVTGKMRFANPLGQGDPDPNGTPYVYVFKNVATPDARTGAPITLQPVLVDPVGVPGPVGSPEGGMGIGRQLALGHANKDGILDICVATKVGLAVFLGQ